LGKAIVLDAEGRRLSPTDADNARQLVREGKADLVRSDPLTIRLHYVVEIPTPPQPQPELAPGAGQRILLHVCCAPCATYSVQRLRELGFEVTGFWCNPNIHPFSEHERRRLTLANYAAQVNLSMIWETGYDVVGFMRAISGHERYRERCRICYKMRLGRTAQAASQASFDAYTTTLLISPYQSQETIRSLGEAAADRYGVRFFFENLRRGWAGHFQSVREHRLYSQCYCGCLYSEWEALDRGAGTNPRAL
jgi:predicted adenine nucleotide alpha hydrolase (AANH) superfamily ATPase